MYNNKSDIIMFSLNTIVYGVGIHLLINTASIYCNALMYPLNMLTNVHCLSEAGHISVKGKTTMPNTPFYTIGNLKRPFYRYFFLLIFCVLFLYLFLS